jgi:excisionase family DNA binding protein
MEPLATKEEVAEYLRVKPETLDAWASRNQGPPFVKVERTRRYRWEDVRRYVEERTVRN